MRVRPDPDKLLGWAFRPDSDTTAALARGLTKLKDKPLGGDRPHFGGNINGEEEKPVAKKVTKKAASKKSTKKTSVKRSRAKVETVDGKIPLKKICQELKIDDKPARVRLRKAVASGKIKFHEHSERWLFTQKQAKDVREFLSS